MNFSISDGFGLIGGWVLFGALMILFTIVVTAVIRIVRGRDDSAGASTPAERSSEDNFIL